MILRLINDNLKAFFIEHFKDLLVAISNALFLRLKDDNL